jgi:phage I-like protein
MRFFTAVLAATLSLSPDAKGQVQLLPAGEFASRDGRPGPGKTWKLSDAQGEKIATALNALLAQTPMVIDYEHHTLTAQERGHKAVAAGWVKHVAWLSGRGLFGDQVEWTPAAQAHIDAKEYQYISPVMTYDDAGNVTGVALAALVNYPGLIGMSPALTAALSGLNPEPTTQEHDVNLLAALIAGLGLKADATEAEVITRVAALQAQVKAPPAVPKELGAALKLAEGADMTAALSAVQSLAGLAASKTTADQTIAALQGEIAVLRAGSAGTELTQLVDKALADGKLLPVMKDWALDSGTGFFLGAQGLLLGNYNTGRFVQINASGDVSMPGLSVTSGVATFSGTLSAANGTFSGAVYGGAFSAAYAWVNGTGFHLSFP